MRNGEKEMRRKRRGKCRKEVEEEGTKEYKKVGVTIQRRGEETFGTEV